MNFLSPDSELTPAEWLRRYAIRRRSHSETDYERLTEIAMFIEQTCDVGLALTDMLERCAIALKGPPAPGTEHGFADLPELIAGMAKGKATPITPTNNEVH